MSTFLFLFLLLNWILFFTFGSLFFILAEGKERYSQFFHKVYDHGKQWLDCVQRRLGLPYWFLCFVLMLSFFLITWVCCSSCDDDCREKETAKVSETVFVFSNESRYSRMHQVKFKEDSLKSYSSIDFTWSILEYLDPNIYLHFIILGFRQY